MSNIEAQQSAHLRVEIGRLTARVAELESERDRLWAWHDAVMAQEGREIGVDNGEYSASFSGEHYTEYAIIRPQPLTKGK